MAAMRLALALALLVSCQTPVPTRRHEDVAESAPQREPPPPSGDSTKLVLASGATMTLPAGARSANAPSGLPDPVKATHVYILGEDARLAVNELAPPPGGCGKALDDEWAKMKKAQGDTDAERLKYRQLHDVAELDLAGRRALYSASRHAPGDGSAQKASLATLLVCGERDYLVLMYAVKRPDLPADAKDKLVAVANSYAAP